MRIMQFLRGLKIISFHLALMLATFTLLLMILFNLVLPKLTRHKQAIMVPDLKEMPLAQCESILKKADLRHQINQEAVYWPQYPPNVVLEQHPKAGAYVKKGRTIYLTLNANQAPEILMPNLVDSSLRNAYLILKRCGLTCGTISYIADIAQGAVLEQRYQDRPIEPGEKIRQGSTIQLVVGAGLKDTLIPVPDLVGRTVEASILLLLEVGMCLGRTHQQVTDTAKADTIVQQVPTAGSEVALGTAVDVWVGQTSNDK